MSSDEASSGVTYTSISSDYEEPSDAGSHGVIEYGYDGLPMHLVDPPSPDYVPGLEEPEQAPLSPNYISGPEYPEYLTPSDAEIPIKVQPHAADASPTALSPGYIADSDLEDESKDGPTDYPADVGDDDDDDSSRDDTDEEDEEEASEEDEEEEEYLAPADSTVVSLAVDPVPSAEETKPFQTDKSVATPPPPPAYRTTARMYIRAQTHISFPSQAESCIPEADIPPQKRLCLTFPTPRFEVGESSTAAVARHPGLGTTRTTEYGFVNMVDDAPRHHVPREVGYGIIDTWDELVDAIQEGVPTTLEEVNTRVTELAENHERDTQDLYAYLEDAQDSRARLSEAWAQAMGCSTAVHYELQAYRAHTQIQDLRISSQETLIATLVAQVSSLQSQLIAALGQIRTLQARDPAHVDDPEDADSCTSMAAGLKMPPRKETKTRTTPATATTTATATTLMTDVAIRALIARGVADALAE
ncbi:hypothetical protein Tco_0435203 [Tanacetum coccineum]